MSKAKRFEFKTTIIALLFLLVAAFAVTPVSAAIEDADYVKELEFGWNLVSVDKPIEWIDRENFVGISYNEMYQYNAKTGAYTNVWRNQFSRPGDAFFVNVTDENGGAIGWTYDPQADRNVPAVTKIVYNGWNMVSCGLEGESAKDILAPLGENAKVLVNNNKLNQDLEELFWSVAGITFDDKNMVPFNGYWLFVAGATDAGLNLPVVYDPEIPAPLEVVSVEAINADELEVDFSAAVGADQAGFKLWRVNNAEGALYTYANATVEAGNHNEVLLNLDTPLADAFATYTFVNKGDAANLPFTWGVADTVTFTPADGTIVPPGVTKPTIEFEAQINTFDGAPVTNANVAVLIEFKKNGAPANFTAIIDGDRKKITITPEESPLANGADYTVAIKEDAIKDSNGIVIPAQDATFTVWETEATFDPANTAQDVALDVRPVIEFNNPIQKENGDPIENADLAALITFKIKNDANVGFTATIDAEKKVITVTPNATLTAETIYEIAIGDVWDEQDVKVDGSGVEWTTRAVTGVTFVPANTTQNVNIRVKPTITFDTAITDEDGTEITNTGVGTTTAVSSLITFNIKGGAAVPFTATINGSKQLITINPTDELEIATDYELTIANVKDADGWLIEEQTVGFKTTPEVEAGKAALLDAFAEDKFATVTSGQNVKNGTGYAQAIVNDMVTGVTVTINASSNETVIDTDGVAKLLGTSTVNFSLTKGADQAFAEFDVIVTKHGAAAQLAVTTEPVPGTRSGTNPVLFATMPVITIQDAAGNTVTTGAAATATITAAKKDGAWTLIGTTTKQAAAGVANFAGTLMYAVPDEDAFTPGCTIEFTATGFTAVTSEQFALATADEAQPNLIGATATSNNANDKWAKAGDVITYNLTFSRAVERDVLEASTFTFASGTVGEELDAGLTTFKRINVTVEAEDTGVESMATINSKFTDAWDYFRTINNVDAINNFVVNDGVVTVDTTAPVANNVVSASHETNTVVTITETNNLFNATGTQINIADDQAEHLVTGGNYDGAAATITFVADYSSGSTVTIVLANANTQNEKTFTIDFAQIKDDAGNLVVNSVTPANTFLTLTSDNTNWNAVWSAPV